MKAKFDQSSLRISSLLLRKALLFPHKHMLIIKAILLLLPKNAMNTMTIRQIKVPPGTKICFQPPTIKESSPMTSSMRLWLSM